METKLTFDDLDDGNGRKDIHKWSKIRSQRHKGFQKSFNKFRIFAFDLNLLKSFLANFNCMVILQMVMAGLVTYACDVLHIKYDVHVSLFVSPIVFPLAFSINTDFQRREKVLEDLAQFMSSSMMWFFCHRDWRESCQFNDAFIKTVRNKLKGLLFHLREYLLTKKHDRRLTILRVIYEDLSDANQLNERVRTSKMQGNSPLVSRLVHFLNMMLLSFERLRVIREYRSPRSIRSFTKVLIFLSPFILSPYYVHLGRGKNDWSPYYISVMVAFVFGALQGVQDKLDDPFDGMSEDDIDLKTLDDWTRNSLEATAYRSYQIGRFQVSKNPPKSEENDDDDAFLCAVENPLNRNSIVEDNVAFSEELESHHPYAGMLFNVQGNETIRRGGVIRRESGPYLDTLPRPKSMCRFVIGPNSDQVKSSLVLDSDAEKNNSLEFLSNLVQQKI